jgi:AbrB family looped-hinge helix DNA binding protein
MAVKVGPKGQVVIEKEIRDQLGVRPGSLAVQRLKGDCVEIRFLQPEHAESLRGRLANKTRRRVPDDGFAAAETSAWEASVQRLGEGHREHEVE